MGLRAYVIKTYKVEYGNTSGFNYGAELLSSILEFFCEDLFIGREGCPDTDVIWEIDRDEFREMIGKIEEMTPGDFHGEFEDNVPEDQAYGKEAVLKTLKGFLKETPDDSDYVRIGWL